MKRALIFVIIVLSLIILRCKQTVDPAIDRDYIVENQDTSPAWSPDGQTIAYTHFEAKNHSLADSLGRYQIWLINPDGTNKRYLTSGSWPGWSPDNQWLAYNYNGSSIITKMRIDGSGFQQLTTNEDGDHGSYNAVWSPDGERILYNIPLAPNAGVWIMDKDGNNKKRIIRSVVEPSWLSDGQRFIARQHTGSHWQICLYDTSGTALDTIVSFDKEYCIGLKTPQVSPDDQTMLFVMSTSATHKLNVYTVNIDGSNLKALTSEGGEDACWSPDGNFICYSHSQRLYTEYVFEYKLWIMARDGSNKHQITFD
jgi:TolB protein